MTLSAEVVEDGYEFFASRQMVTLFSAPNYCGEFDNAGAMMTVRDDLMCSFQLLKPSSKKCPTQIISRLSVYYSVTSSVGVRFFVSVALLPDLF